MASPANIRISAQFLFPALVVGGAPVAVAKANGIWTIALNVAGLAAQTPAAANYPTDFLLVYDAVALTFFKMPLGGVGHARTQRNVTASPIVIAGTDQILNLNLPGVGACALPAAAGRNGLPLTFKAITLPGAITLTPNGAETIDGAAQLVINVNKSVITLVPFNDGTNTGWSVQ